MAERSVVKEVTSPASIIIPFLIAGAAMSLLVFSNLSLRLDEAQSLWQSSKDLKGLVSEIARDVHVPLYHIVLHYWQLLFNNSEIAARSLSLLFYICTIPFIYLLGRDAFGKQVGIFAAVLASISPFLLWYANEIRMYTMLALFAVVNQYFFLNIFRSNNSEAWFGYRLSAAFGIFTHYFFILILITQAIFFMLKRSLFPKESLRRFIVSAFVLVALMLPWQLYARSLGSFSFTQPLLAPPKSIDIFNAFAQFMFGFQDIRINTAIVAFWPLTALLGFMLLKNEKKFPAEALYFILSIVVPIALSFAVSLFARPIFLSRYLIIVIPAVYILLGWTLDRLPAKLASFLKYMVIVLMIISLVVQSVSGQTPVKEDYRAATKYLNENARASDIIAVSAPFTIYPVDYYYQGPSSIVTIPNWDRTKTGPIPEFKIETLEQDLKKYRGTYERMWVLLSVDQGYEEKLHLYLDENLERVDKKEFVGMELYLYKLRYDLDLERGPLSQS